VQELEVQQVLKSYIAREWLQGQEAGLDANTALLDLGILDSLRMVSLLAFIEERFGVKVPEEDVAPIHFANIDALSRLIQRALS
jgi:2-hydroxymuconate-semialdehyde hydrolase